MEIYLANKNGMMNDVAKHFKIVDDQRDAEAILTWHCGTDKKGMDIPIILFQHGFGYDYPIICDEPPADDLMDKLLVWNKRSKIIAIKNGIDKDKIVITGSPIFTHLKPKIKHTGINIIYAPTHNMRVKWIENRELAKDLRGLNVKITTKLLDKQHDTKYYDNPVISNVNSKDHFKISIKLLQKADLVVSLTGGTFAILAEAMDIPTIILHNNTYTNVSTGEIIKRWTLLPSYLGARVVYAKEELFLTIKDELANLERLKKLRREDFINAGGLIKNPVKNIVREIKKYEVLSNRP